MEHFCSIGIGGLDVAVMGEKGHFASLIMAKYKAFLSNNKSSLIVELHEVQGAFPEQNQWHVLVEKDSNGQVTGFQGCGFRLSLIGSPWRMKLELVPLVNAFDRCLRVLLSSVLPCFDGVVVHAATIENNGNGYLFSAPSGGGKTTISRISLLSGKKVLTDELSVVRKVGDHYFVYGTPFHGDCCTPDFFERYPLAAAFQLSKDNRTVYIRNDPAAAVAGLMRCALNFRTDHLTNERLLGILSDIVCRVPQYKLFFGRQDRIWRELEKIDEI